MWKLLNHDYGPGPHVLVAFLLLSLMASSLPLSWWEMDIYMFLAAANIALAAKAIAFDLHCGCPQLRKT